MQSALHSVIGPRKEVHDLNGRVALVTGGAMGIGSVHKTFLQQCYTVSVPYRKYANVGAIYRYEISHALVLNGARVIMVNRKEEQGQEAIKKLKEEVGENGKVEWLGCDMGNLQEVKHVFTGIRDREDRLDLVRLWSMQSSFDAADPPG